MTGRAGAARRRRRAASAGARPDAAVRRRRDRADGAQRRPARPAAADAPHRPDGAGGRRRKTRLPDHHRQPGFLAARRARRCAPPTRRSRSSTMSARASGPGGRAARRRCGRYVDHILCLLPFEPEELARLGGPPAPMSATALTHDPGVLAAAERRPTPRDPSADSVKTLLVLPGSRARRGEAGLSSRSARRCDVLRERGHRLRLLLPTVPHVSRAGRDSDGALAASSRRSSSTPKRKWQAFARGRRGAHRVRHGLAGTGACRRAGGLLLQARPDRARLHELLIKVWSARCPT